MTQLQGSGVVSGDGLFDVVLEQQDDRKLGFIALIEPLNGQRKGANDE